MPVEWFDRETLMDAAASCLEPVDLALDIGTGIRPHSFIQAKLYIFCEPFASYVEALQEKYKQAPNVIILQTTGQILLPTMPDQSVDLISMIDVIEHIDKVEGRELLAACERVARRQIVLFTPLGFVPQDYESGEQDAWGLQGVEWQRHLSGWEPEDFDGSWRILACKDFHRANGKGEPLNPPVGAMWAIKNLESSTLASDNFDAGLSRHIAVLSAQVSALKDQNLMLEQRLAQLDHLIVIRFERWLRRVYRRLFPR